MVGGCLLVHGQQPGKDRTSLPELTRVRLAGEHREIALGQLRVGNLQSMSLPEFDKLVEEATLADAARENPPRLLTTHYQAMIVEDGNLQGAAQWAVLHDQKGPGLLPLCRPPFTFNLALTKRPSTGSGPNTVPVYLADFDGKGSGALLLDRQGEQTVDLAWTASGSKQAQGVRFDLTLPRCPVAVLDLYTPPGWTVSTTPDILVAPQPRPEINTGPPSEWFGRTVPQDYQRWQVCFGGRPGVEMLLHPAPPASTPQRIVRRQVATQTLSPDGVEARYSIDVESSPVGMRQLRFRCDRGLRPWGVQVMGTTVSGGKAEPVLESWSFRGNVLDILLRQEVRTVEVLIEALAPLPDRVDQREADPWTSPTLRLEEGIPRGETLILRLHPDLRVGGWEPGSFRLTETGRETDRGVSWTRLKFSGGGLLIRPDRPRVRLQASAAEYRARQLAWWQIQAGGMSLALDIRYQVQRGSLFDLKIQLPEGWEPEDVKAVEAGIERWWIRTEKGGPSSGTSQGARTLVVQLEQPLKARDQSTRTTGDPLRTEVTLLVRLRTRGKEEFLASIQQPIPLPNAVPLGARFQEGVLAIDLVNDAFTPVLKTNLMRGPQESSPGNPMEAIEPGPWGRFLPELYFPYRGEPVQGTLQLRPRPAHLRAVCRTQVEHQGDQAVIGTEVEVAAESGLTETIDVAFSASPGTLTPSWTILPDEVNGEAGESTPYRIARVERVVREEVAAGLAALAGGHPLEVALLQSACPAGSRWRLTLSPPLTSRKPLRMGWKTTLARSDSGGWVVPLPTLPEAQWMQGEVTLGSRTSSYNPSGISQPDLHSPHPGGSSQPALQPTTRFGLEESPTGAGGVRRFRYHRQPVTLAVGETPSAAQAPRIVGRFTSIWMSGGGIRNHYQFWVADWGSKTLSVQLPFGSQLDQVYVEGRRLERPAVDPFVQNGPMLHLPAIGPLAPWMGGANEEPVAWRRFEVVYTSPLNRGWFWTSLQPGSPILPVKPLFVERRWLLPPGVQPFAHSKRLVAGSEAPAWSGRRPADLFRLLSKDLGNWRPSWLEDSPRQTPDEQRLALADAVLNIPSRSEGKPRQLRDILEPTARALFRQRHILLVDTRALQEAELNPGSVVDRDVRVEEGPDHLPWEQVGIVTMWTPAGPLLTSRRQYERWCQPGEGADAAPAAPAFSRMAGLLAPALREAIESGRDASGRFQTALYWLHHSAPVLDEKEWGNLPGWTVWEPVEGDAVRSAEMLVVHQDGLGSLAWGLTILVVLLFWALRHRSVTLRVTFLWLWLGLSGLGLLWLPASITVLVWRPFLVGAVTALIWYLLVVTRRRSPGRRGPGRRSAAALKPAVLLLLGPVSGLLSEDPRTEPKPFDGLPGAGQVFVIGDPDREQDRVLLTPALANRLEQLSFPGGPGTAPAVLVGAEYAGQGKASGSRVQMKATFWIYSAGAKPATVQLPLEGVLLQSPVWLDDALTHLVALTPPEKGYGVRVRGKGLHKLELTFEVVIQSDSESPGRRILSWTPPPVAQNKLRLELTEEISYLDVDGALGRMQTSGGDRTTLDVDLGSMRKPLQVSWYDMSNRKPAKDVHFHEAYIWHLRHDASRLTGLILFEMEDFTTRFQIELPGDMVVQGVGVNRPSGEEVRFREWQTEPNGKSSTLVLDLGEPTHGRCLVKLELAPRAPLKLREDLPVPTPQGKAVPGGGFLAYSSQGLGVSVSNPRGLTGVTPEKFAPFWPVSVYPREEALSAAFSFRRDATGQVSLPVLLRLRPPITEARQDIRLRPGIHQVEFQARIDVKAREKDLALIEWELISPEPLTIVEVRGNNIRDWSQTDPRRLLVWLEQTTDAAQLELTGWLPLQQQKEGGVCHFPCLKLLSAQAQQTTLVVEPKPGFALHSFQSNQLRQDADPAPSTQEAHFQTTQQVWTGSCTVAPETVVASSKVLTFIEVVDGRLQLVSGIRLRVEQGRMSRFQLELRHWPVDLPVEIKGDRIVRTTVRHLGPQARVWVVDVAAQEPGEFGITLSSSQAISAGLLILPEPVLTVADMHTNEAWLAAVAPDVIAEDVMGLQRVEEILQDLAPWPGQAERLRRKGGALWKVVSPHWDLRLRVYPVQHPENTRGSLVWQTATATPTLGGSWLYTLSACVAHPPEMELTVTPPAGAQFFEVWRNGRDLTPLVGGSELKFPIIEDGASTESAENSGIRVSRVRLSWKYHDDRDQPEEPRMAVPVWEATEDSSLLWTVLAPSGWTVAESRENWFTPGQQEAARHFLAQAEAELKISALLVEQSGEQTERELEKAQDRFHRAWFRAGELLVSSGGEPADPGLRQQLADLRERNRALAAGHGFEQVSKQAEDRARRTDRQTLHNPLRVPFTRGIPWYSRTLPPGIQPTVRLTPRNDQGFGERLSRSTQWVIVVAVLWLLSYLPALIGRLRVLVPEQVALLGTLGWFLVGPTPVVLTLLLIWVCVRLLHLVRGLRWLWRASREEKRPQPA